MLARIGVGVGEAGTSPPSHAMIADMYAPNERATPLAIFALGINIGLLIAFFGRWMGEPSLWLAHRLSGCRPARPVTGRCCHVHLARSAARLSDGHEAQKAPPLGEVALYILHNKTLRQLIIGSTLVVTGGLWRDCLVADIFRACSCHDDH
ncbi:MAG: hypothetical protein CM15mP21_0270 [Hyphomicrobiales bacterium]|nr:MAG: hypothetical protein CM15mP21_0270 [Hyphomicrobiales bacterium]